MFVAIVFTICTTGDSIEKLLGQPTPRLQEEIVATPMMATTARIKFLMLIFIVLNLLIEICYVTIII